mgnify:CR=1 FL=1
MTYFTSWDVNLYLCLFTLGLPHDLALEIVGKLKSVHREHCLEDARAYYCDRGKWMPDEWMLVDRDREWRIVNWGPRWSDQKEINMRAIAEIESIPFFFWNNLNKLNLEYEEFVRKIEPHDRNDYFEWAYENYYHGWSIGILEWAKGFHPGRWILMDKKRGETLEDIRELEDYGAYSEERFIRSKKHIDELLNR